LTGDGVSVGLNTVGRIMREHAIRPWYCKPFRRPRRDKDRQNVKPNDLDRAFQPGMPNRAWLSDITEFRTFEGKLYLSVVEDLGTRRVLGWAMSNRMRAELVEESLQMAIKLRGKP
jgi:transposase InsO family protein